MSDTDMKYALDNAHTLGAFRGCRHGDAIAYRATLEATGPAAIAAILRELERGFYIHDINHPGRYAVLDVLDANGSLMETHDIPDVIAFDKMRESLALRVIDNDCPFGCN